MLKHHQEKTREFWIYFTDPWAILVSGNQHQCCQTGACGSSKENHLLELRVINPRMGPYSTATFDPPRLTCFSSCISLVCACFCISFTWPAIKSRPCSRFLISASKCSLAAFRSLTWPKVSSPYKQGPKHCLYPSKQRFMTTTFRMLRLLLSLSTGLITTRDKMNPCQALVDKRDRATEDLCTLLTLLAFSNSTTFACSSCSFAALASSSTLADNSRCFAFSWKKRKLISRPDTNLIQQFKT